MKLNGIEISVVKANMAAVKASLKAVAFIDTVDAKSVFKEIKLKAGKIVVYSSLNKKSSFVLGAILKKRGLVTESLVRNAAYNLLTYAQKKSFNSIALGFINLKGCGLKVKDVSKIMAQEVFRYSTGVKNKSLKRIIFALGNVQSFKIFNKQINRYLAYMDKEMRLGPYLTVDGIVEHKGGIIMIKRSNPPLGWALPGGFVDYNESVEKAVVREIKEETNLNFVRIEQVKVYSDPQRDPRFHTVSVVFKGKGQGVLRSGSDASEARVFSLDALPEIIAFDHRRIIEDYIETIN
ncbi:MAG: NUDIX domain-containing protein [Candidatus Omnitrophota bacterium]